MVLVLRRFRSIKTEIINVLSCFKRNWHLLPTLSITVCYKSHFYSISICCYDVLFYSVLIFFINQCFAFKFRLHTSSKLSTHRWNKSMFNCILLYLQRTKVKCFEKLTVLIFFLLPSPTNVHRVENIKLTHCTQITRKFTVVWKLHLLIFVHSCASNSTDYRNHVGSRKSTIVLIKSPSRSIQTKN